MTVLITGGAGFIGSRLALRLAAEGTPIVIIDNFDDYYDPTLKRQNIDTLLALGGDVTLLEGDLRDAGLIEQAFKAHRFTQVAHLAALGNVRYSIERGRLFADVNVSATVSLLDTARRYGVENFVFASSSSVYGSTSQIPFREDDPAILPLAPYPASKRAAELFAQSYHQLFGLNVNVLRFFNVYGPHGRPDMMPLRVMDSILNDKVIPLFGAGQFKRDWTYIDDIIDGVAAALERPLGFRTFNLGFGSPITLLEFIHIFETLIGKRAITQDVEAPASEPPVTYCDNTLARSLLGFDPKVQIEEGLARTWAWYQSQVLRRLPPEAAHHNRAAGAS